ncbi:MAG: 4Fe-4S dicluster domain-containing protein [Candidatus Helarchaeota archaeon]|nr:4Fe-4S dicluster domain-containing protein [Candidatus Helarchaeota archaeon]
MSETDPYEKLRRKLNLFTLRVPKTKTFHKLLELLYTPEEAEIISTFGMPYIDYMRVPWFIKKSKTEKSEEEISEMFENLVKRGVLFKRIDKKGRPSYALAPYIPGIFEFYFMSKAEPPEKMKEVAHVLEDYFFDTFAPETFNSSKYPFFRVLPAQKAVEKVIELGEEVPTEFQVLPFEIVSQYISSARRIAVGICPCRDHAELIDGKSRCDKPRDVCMVFEAIADYWVEKGIARYVDHEEAMEVLRRAEDAGLVHSTTNNQLFGLEIPGMICNCCPCCCFILQGILKVNRPRGIAQSNFDPVIDRELCKICKECIDVCPMGAIFHHPPHKDDLSDNLIYVTLDKCIGCGLCASNCPHNAITMKKIRSQIPEETAAGSSLRYLKEHIH